jgi:hypothetical protein
MSPLDRACKSFFGHPMAGAAMVATRVPGNQRVAAGPLSIARLEFRHV